MKFTSMQVLPIPAAEEIYKPYYLAELYMPLTSEELKVVGRAEKVMRRWKQGEVPPEYAGTSSWEQLRYYVEPHVMDAIGLLLHNHDSIGQTLREKYSFLVEDAERIRNESGSFSPSEMRRRDQELRLNSEWIIHLLHQCVERGRRELAVDTRGTATPDDSPAGRIPGITWQQAREAAERIVDGGKFPGLTKLARQIGCHTRTLGKAIRNSKKLQEAQAAYMQEVGRAKAIGLSDQLLAITESRAVEPSEEATTNEILETIGREGMITKILKWTTDLNQINGRNVIDAQSLADTLRGLDDKGLVETYLTAKEQIDDHKKERGRGRRRRP